MNTLHKAFLGVWNVLMDDFWLQNDLSYHQASRSGVGQTQQGPLFKQRLDSEVQTADQIKTLAEAGGGGVGLRVGVVRGIL